MAELEMRLRIYYESTGCEDYIEVCEDADGLGSIELRYRDENDKIGARINLHDGMAEQMIEALRTLQAFRATQHKGEDHG
jgi:hypothetical protein